MVQSPQGAGALKVFMMPEMMSEMGSNGSVRDQWRHGGTGGKATAMRIMSVCLSVCQTRDL